MGFCLQAITCCIGIILALAILAFIFFKWVFVRKGSTRIIRGPGGFRVEYEDSKETYDSQRKFEKPAFKRWTCSCGETVEPGQEKCPSCGKRRDEGTIDVEYEDHPGDSPGSDDYKDDSLIDF